MMNKKMVFSPYFTVLLLALFLSGCAGTVKNMRVVPLDKVVTAPEEGKSRVVFMRPSGMGSGVQSSVFEIKEDNPSLVGIVAAKKKLSYSLEPGKHLFMVVGESADFMYAELQADKTYYALVTPRMGVWKARFSLKPIHSGELSSAEFKEWQTSGESVEKSPASDSWANANMASIQSKYKEYYADWMEKGASERPKLFPQDGQ